MYRFTRTIVALLSLTLLAAACGTSEAKAPSRSGDALVSGETIVDIAVADADFSTLVQAVTTADLAGTLAGTGPFTVFAPTNEAFAASLDEAGLTAEELLADTELLTSVLQNHVVSGNVLADQVVALDGDILITLSGNRLPIALSGANVTIDGVSISQTDILANNGVIHVVDRVIFPPS